MIHKLALERPGRAGAGEISAVLASWEPPGGCAAQLHVGDIGWNLRVEDDHVDDMLLVWRLGDGAVAAIGLLDDPSSLRVAVDPGRASDDVMAAQLAEHIEDVLKEGAAAVDGLPAPAALRLALAARGWTAAPDAWVHLWRPIGPDDAARDTASAGPLRTDGDLADRVAVQVSAFEGSTSTVERWRLMQAGPAYDAALDLLVRDNDGVVAAGATAWSAGPGRCAILEPVGTHRDHQGRGHGRSVIEAACTALARTGASGVAVHTPASNVGAVAAYRAAGFRSLGPVADMRRS
jgi:GNAT superfamily N-acetyltransferase